MDLEIKEGTTLQCYSVVRELELIPHECCYLFIFGHCFCYGLLFMGDLMTFLTTLSSCCTNDKSLV